jgi:hypothetical protein
VNSHRKNAITGVGLGTLVGFVFMFGGYLLVRGDWKDFGYVVFLLVPFVAGFAVAAVVRRPGRVLACCACGLILTLSVLLFTGLEGYLCCLMASPLIAAGMAVGAVIGYQVRGKIIDKLAEPATATVLLLLICPLFIAAADRFERPIRSVQQREVVTTETTVPGSPDRIWDLVGQMQKLDGPRPFLLQAGLPVPTRCELDRAEIGGRRICYFDAGVITQEITEWRRPEFMGLRVRESTLPGRQWLTFIDASYELSAVGRQTRIVRHTTIGTRLYPRWYWRPLERWGVASEHEFVFSNLQRWAAGQ